MRLLGERGLRKPRINDDAAVGSRARRTLLVGSIAASLMAVGLTVVTAPANADTGCPTPVAPEGDGDSDSPYLIASKENLQWVKDHRELAPDPDDPVEDIDTPVQWAFHYRMTTDIDMDGCIWEDSTIGNGSFYFEGVFDGDGRSIFNFRLITGSRGGGLFGYNEGLITDLVIWGSVTSTGDYVGGVVGRNYNSGRMLNVHSNVAVRGTDSNDSDYVGGLVGENRGLIEQSSARAEVEGARAFVGGLVGYQDEGSIIDSYATGSVSGLNTVGGLVGLNDEGVISRSYASGDVESTGSVADDGNVGGLVGSNDDGVITRSYASGEVTSTSTQVGGLVGLNKGDGQITQSYATGDVQGLELVGGFIGFHDVGVISESFATGTVTGTDPTDSYEIGGFVGRNFADITDSYARGDVLGSASDVGGFVGLNAGAISNAYATGAVDGLGKVGGFVGYNFAGGEVSNSFASGAVDSVDVPSGPFVGLLDGGSVITGGGAAPIEEMSDIDTFLNTDPSWDITAGWSEVSVWGICVIVNEGFPFLSWAYSSDPCNPGSSGTDNPPIMIFQGLPLPDSGECSDVNDSEFSYGTGLSGGWQRGWEMWQGPEGIGSFVCIRVLVKQPGRPWKIDNSAL